MFVLSKNICSEVNMTGKERPTNNKYYILHYLVIDKIIWQVKHVRHFTWNLYFLIHFYAGQGLSVFSAIIRWVEGSRRLKKFQVFRLFIYWVGTRKFFLLFLSIWALFCCSRASLFIKKIIRIVLVIEEKIMMFSQ